MTSPNFRPRVLPSSSHPEHSSLLGGGNSGFSRTNQRTSSLQGQGSAYPVDTHSSISSKFSLTPDPNTWGSALYPNTPEPDDYLHDPDPKRDRHSDCGGSFITSRSFSNLGCLLILALGVLTLFVGYPLITYMRRVVPSSNGGFNIGGINATGQIPVFHFGLIDPDTPSEAYTHKSYTDDSTLQLVFSDEFNVDGRTFYPGEDPYWEALDLHYWGTNNLEWYDPAAITTKDGSLEITLSIEDPASNHNMTYRGGMVTTWNKFCFTGGMILASVTLPGASNVAGLWPAVWTLGNLGRAGYGATLDGMWPYSYDSCDVGTLQNQTLNGLPLAATQNGDPTYEGVLSYLPGQRLSRCTCEGESHPGPVHADGTYVGRAAPEIDVIEAQVSNGIGHVSQSGQWAPYNEAYQWTNTTDNYIIYDETVAELNQYKGGVYQQATSAVAITNQNCYELNTGCFSVYGFEYVPGFDAAYITWINDDKPAWTLFVAGVGPDAAVEISGRPIPPEPLYLIINLGLSENFGAIDYDHLTFPTVMSVDWIRVYQHEGKMNLGCDPPEFPTAAYINTYMEAYTNPNHTTWIDDFGQSFPKNRLVDQC
ncbi:glycoside hydrolase family 16 protein [Dendrothele bispora CBS 962.96]|uniref:Glycoside hydrolase family 16 protein n=1 Tax=Dendrothele bispora (strain CBS 962.96) TaxID=1314807 RepID=A0A4S8L0A1_DENBC|nr:glycoside hydrolase family 16 protein [Dendrothele bispora CBS 962.96]